MSRPLNANAHCVAKPKACTARANRRVPFIQVIQRNTVGRGDVVAGIAANYSVPLLTVRGHALLRGCGRGNPWTSGSDRRACGRSARGYLHRGGSVPVCSWIPQAFSNSNG